MKKLWSKYDDTTLRAFVLANQDIQRMLVVARRVAFNAISEWLIEKPLKSFLNFRHVNFWSCDDKANELTIIGS